MSLDWTPARRPPREPIAGERVRLEPLEPRHAPELFRASQGPGADPELWKYLPYGPFTDDAEYADWIRSQAAGDDPLFFAIIDSESGDARGVASYLRITPEHGTIEIGHIWLGAGLQRTAGATEAMYLLARTAFDELGHRRLEWKCNAENRDSDWYALIDGEWPAAKRAFEAWLDPANFDADGRQRRSLAELREAG
jgi:RimJ/RimL family protein N-acetyltransferase